MTIKLTTQFVHPPIGTRLFDWCCYPNSDEESCYYGWGRTEQDAINDWNDQWGDEINHQVPSRDSDVINQANQPKGTGVKE